MQWLSGSRSAGGHGGHRRRPAGSGAPSSTVCSRPGTAPAAPARPRRTEEAPRLDALGDVEVVIGDIAKPDTAARCLHGVGRDVDVIHTAGHHPSDDDAAVLRGQRRRHAQRRRRRARPRRAADGARLVEQPVRHQPPAAATRSGRRAVPPVLRLRPVEDAGRAGVSTPSSAASTRRSCGRRGSTARSSRRGRRRSSGWCAPAGSRWSATASSGARWSTSTTSSTACSPPS